MAASWRLAVSIDKLRSAVNAAWPNRAKASDGTIGDARHQGEVGGSDHNPNALGVVRAFDITSASIPAEDLAERLRSMAKAGDPRLNGGGYLIWNRRICSEKNSWVWRAYSGSDPHTNHIHVSVATAADAYDLATPWDLVPAALVAVLLEDDMKTTLVNGPDGYMWTVTLGAHHLGKRHISNPARLKDLLYIDAMSGGTILTGQASAALSADYLAEYPTIGGPVLAVPISAADVTRIAAEVAAQVAAQVGSSKVAAGSDPVAFLKALGAQLVKD